MKETNLEKGILAENLIAKELRELYECEVSQNHTWGVDIEIQKGLQTILVEVKSASYFVKNGSKVRKGNFYFYPYNLERADYFAFVINNNFGPRTIWVKGGDIVEYFKNHKKRTKLCLTIPSLLNRVKKIDFSEVISVGL